MVVVAARELATGQERYSQRAEVAVAHVYQPRRRRFVASRYDHPLWHEADALSGAAEWNLLRGAGRHHAGQRAHAIEYLGVVAVLQRLGALMPVADAEIDYQHVIGTEAEVHAKQPDEAARHEPCADHENDRDGDFAYHERCSRLVSARAAAPPAAFSQRGLQVG